MSQEINLREVMSLYTDKRYLTRKEILFRVKPQSQLDVPELWNSVMELRQLKGKTLSLLDQKSANFWFMLPPFAEKMLHDLSFIAKHKLEELATKEFRKKVLLEDMVFEEAFYSSVIEGAFSTRKRAKEVIESKKPKNKSEQMILNNFHAMLYILENLNQKLTEETLLDIYKIVTQDTLEEDEVTEKYRDDQVYVTDPNKTEPIYIPPDAKYIQPMTDCLFAFINDNEESSFIHPIIKAFIIHFYIGYIHPFYDGNGRVARAFSYMYLLKEGYEFFKFFSISSMINKHRKKYYQSFIDSEENDSDLTYFIVAHLDISLKSIHEVLERLLVEFNSQLLKDALERDGIFLSSRQEKFIRFLEKKDNNLTTIEDYRKKYNIAYETARRDLMELEQLGIFKKIKKGKKNIFAFQGFKGYLG